MEPKRTLIPTATLTHLVSPNEIFRLIDPSLPHRLPYGQSTCSRYQSGNHVGRLDRCGFQLLEFGRVEYTWKLGGLSRLD